MHALLARQLQSFGGTADAPPSRWSEFLRAVEEAYVAGECGRASDAEIALRTSEARLRDEIADRERLAVELRVRQKLESVGQLAAGIAHEINTPVQYVGDSVHFLQSAFHDYRIALDAYRRAMTALADPATDVAALSAALERVEADADLAYLEERIPRAFERVCDGTERVATIVRAMKEFANPESHATAPADLNRALLTTLTIARNEYKYVADVVTDLAELPAVRCAVGDLNEVFLTLIVNAAHAIAERHGKDGPRGTIRVATASEGAHVRITVEDDGCGIPEANRERVFDPFFTTKPPGRGTGQGLAIARSIVVDRHRGTLEFDSVVGQGSRFAVRLPVDAAAGKERAA